MALPLADWLHLAQRLPIAGHSRVRHKNEGRPNLVITNLPDRWTAYCQACKQGGVQMKTHVRVTGIKAPVLSDSLVLPHDMMRVIDCEEMIKSGVLGFLAKKNMDAMYLPELWFSKSRMRLMIQHGDEWLGRDTTEASPQKWLSFNRSTHLDNGRRYKDAVVVEDPFSFHKVSYALRDSPYAVYCSLGTCFHPSLLLKLLKHSQVHTFYDGDEAGWKGSIRESKRVRACGVSCVASCAPAGLDPKDLTIEQIRIACALPPHYQEVRL